MAKRRVVSKDQMKRPPSVAEPRVSKARRSERSSPPARKKAASNGRSRGASRNGNGLHLAPVVPVLPRTHLSDEELDYYRGLLIEKRGELVGDMSHMENEALRRTRSDASGDLSMMPIHMADIGTDNYEQEFTIGLIAGERAVLKEIDEALARINDRTYGICLATHQPISRARLKARPWSRYCVEHERLQENGLRRRFG